VSELSGTRACASPWEPGRLLWSQRTVGDAVEVRLAGELDLSTATEFRKRLLRVAHSEAATTIVLDLSQVGFIDALSTGVIVGAHTAAESRGRRLQIDGLHGSPARVFDMLGLDWMRVRRPHEGDLGEDAGEIWGEPARSVG
jgi:anti-anti-sigma factor